MRTRTSRGAQGVEGERDRHDETVESCLGRLLDALSLEKDEILKDVVLRSVTFQGDSVKSFPIHAAMPASMVSEVVLVRKGG